MPTPVITLIPLAELTPGSVGAIRNQVINSLIQRASTELNKKPEDLVVRDVRPFNDLSMLAAGTTIKTTDIWLYDATTTTANAFTSVTGAATMGDQRYVALFGVRDLRKGIGIHTTDMSLFTSTSGLLGTASSPGFNPNSNAVVSQIRITVGGSDKVIWDVTSLVPYDVPVGFTPSAVVIPQNTSFNIGYYFMSTIAGVRAWLQLIGVVVEPRGRVLTP